MILGGQGHTDGDVVYSGVVAGVCFVLAVVIAVAAWLLWV